MNAMKSFLAIFTFLPLIASATPLQLSNNPFEELKKAFDNSPHAPTLDQIPWATEVNKTWKGCVNFFEGNIRSKSEIIIFKWIKRENNGPILPSDEIRVNLFFSKVDFDKNENVFKGTPFEQQINESYWEVDSSNHTLYIRYKTLAEEQSYHALRTDGKYIFFKQFNPYDYSFLSYGYCWR